MHILTASSRKHSGQKSDKEEKEGGRELQFCFFSCGNIGSYKQKKHSKAVKERREGGISQW